MFILYILLFITIILTIHLIFLPISKKRPILLIGTETTIYIIALVMTITFLMGPISYILGLAAGLFLILTKAWIIIGVSKENLFIALDKAVLASRSEVVKEGNTYIIENSLKIKILTTYSKISIVINRNIAYSKKAVLTQNIWKKFIQNYFI